MKTLYNIIVTFTTLVIIVSVAGVLLGALLILSGLV